MSTKVDLLLYSSSYSKRTAMMGDYKESDYKELTKEEKKNMMLLFKKALIDNDEEQFFELLHFVIGDWYLWACAGFPTTATKAPKEGEEVLKAGGNYEMLHV